MTTPESKAAKRTVKISESGLRRVFGHRCDQPDCPVCFPVVKLDKRCPTCGSDERAKMRDPFNDELIPLGGPYMNCHDAWHKEGSHDLTRIKSR